ncbi:MAG: aminotransferase class I/II-fold pyridoxal phosphate-dependent enzyme, partial [Coriobacteriaceae bacterium]|nr:aminotransferase class I/II-fold pyridoxal phosphate-dependent enzyme [Coriobacteriaceae bacterium]
MLYFDSDYMEGAHPKIIERLAETNLEQTYGYGTDDHCASAREKIKRACNAPDAEVFFLVGGTQTNATVIDAILKPWEGVISSNAGHINTHEAGTVEAFGHKVLEIPHEQGKLTFDALRSYLEAFHADFTNDHMVQPGMIYISHPTEYGTLYSKAELEALSKLCNKYELALYLDGARLGYGLAAPTSDVTLEDIARLCDAFYIGGTKVGALFGEALVLTNPRLHQHFFTLMKQHGAVLAKGRMLGIQFDTLFCDELYFEGARHALAMAEKLKAGFLAAGYSLYLDSPTNQQFPVLENAT